MKPGIYPEISMREYHALPAVNAGLLKTLLERCPKAAWFESWLNPGRPASTSDDAQRIGTVAHSIFLEGDASVMRVIDPKDHPNKTKPFAVPAGWTNTAMQEARAAAIADGKTPMLPEEAGKVTEMLSALREYLDSLRKRQPAVWELFQPDGGDSEVTMLWEDEGGTLCRFRPDRISKDRKLIGDYKTVSVSAQPDAWARMHLFKLGYPTSAGFYRRGAKRLFNVTPDYVYLVQEQEEPFLCSLVGLNPQVYEFGDRRAARGLDRWIGCAKAGHWPGYPADVAYPEIPVWEVARDEVEELDGNAYDYPDLGWGKHLKQEAA